MKNYLQTHPFAKIGVFAFLLIPFILLINAYSPPPELLPEDYSSTILALEFVQSQEAAEAILSPLSIGQIKDLDTINYIDFGFMFFYSLILWMFSQKLKLIQHWLWLRYLVALPVLIFCFDLLENIQLLRITDLFLTGSGQEQWIQPLRWVQVFTWLKWGGLAFCFLLFAIALFKAKPFLIVSCVIFTVPFILLIAVLFKSTTELKDLFASSVFMVFFALVLFCFAFSIPPSTDDELTQL